MNVWEFHSYEEFPRREILELEYTYVYLKFIFSKKATKIDEIFTVDLTFTTYRQIDGEDFFKFCGLFRKHKL